MYPTRGGSPKMSRTLLSLLVIWTASLLISSPLIFAMNLDIIRLPDPIIHIAKVSHLAYCAEEWGEYNKGRLVYSIFSLGEANRHFLRIL